MAKKWFVLCLMLLCTFRAQGAGKLVDQFRGLLKNGVALIPYAGPAVKDFFFGNDAEELLHVQREALSTNRKSLTGIQQAAQELLTIKSAVEQWDQRWRQGMAIGRHLLKLDYTKAIVGLTAAGMGISANPSDYIPRIAGTKALRKALNYDCSAALPPLQRAERWWERTRKALSTQPPTDRAALQTSLHEAAAHDHTAATYATKRKLSLAHHYEQQAQALLKNNTTLKAMLEDETAHSSLAERLATYRLLHENLQAAAHMKERATTLIEESTRPSPEERAALEIAEDRAFVRELISDELDAQKE